MSSDNPSRGWKGRNRTLSASRRRASSARGVGPGLVFVAASVAAIVSLASVPLPLSMAQRRPPTISPSD